jgi:acetylornithine/N-succinyldiaminopimelate aminotransferase
LQAIVGDHGLVGERGVGLLRALVLPGDVAHDVAAAARDLSPVGLLLNAPRPNLLRLMPALTISEDEIDEALQLLRDALRVVLA